MKVTDILMPKIAESPFFVVNNGVLSVTTQNAAPTTFSVLYSAFNGALGCWFPRNNNIQIVRMGYEIPEPFKPYTEATAYPLKIPIFSLHAYKHATSTYQALTIGNFIPQPNEFIDLYNFIDVEELIADNFQLCVHLDYNFSVSMVNAPAALNGLKFYVKPYLLVEMNTNLTRYWDH